MSAARPFHRHGNAGAISLRETVVGGVLTRGTVSPPAALAHSDKIVLLVHGFNVTQADADRSYDEFQRNLDAALHDRIVRLYWPGDTSTKRDAARGEQGRVTRIISPLLYPRKPAVAVRGARKVQRLFKEAFAARRRSGKKAPLEICVVAHSLGCRLTMELLERIIVADGSAADLRLAILMAAAVPQLAVLDDGDFQDTVAEMQQLWILRSKSDGILFGVFRPGQLFDTPLLRFRNRSALGRTGIAATEKIRVTEGVWGHGDYWPDREIAHAMGTELIGGLANNAFDMLDRVVTERRVEKRDAEERAIEKMLPIW